MKKTNSGGVKTEVTRSFAETGKVRRQRERRRQYEEQGFCRNHKVPAKYPFSKCEQCLEKHRDYTRWHIAKTRQTYKIGGRCICCGVLLDAGPGGADEGRTSCYSCRHPLLRPEREYAGFKRVVAVEGRDNISIGGHTSRNISTFSAKAQQSN